jgi:hypothetical protein
LPITDLPSLKRIAFWETNDTHYSGPGKSHGGAFQERGGVSRWETLNRTWLFALGYQQNAFTEDIPHFDTSDEIATGSTAARRKNYRRMSDGRHVIACLMNLPTVVYNFFCCDSRFERLPEIVKEMKIWRHHHDACYDMEIRGRRFLVCRTTHSSAWLRNVLSIALNQSLLPNLGLSESLPATAHVLRWPQKTA